MCLCVQVFPQKPPKRTFQRPSETTGTQNAFLVGPKGGMKHLFGQKVMNGARVQKDLKDLVLVAACGACVFSCFWVPENSVQLREN